MRWRGGEVTWCGSEVAWWCVGVVVRWCGSQVAWWCVGVVVRWRYNRKGYTSKFAPPIHTLCCPDFVQRPHHHVYSGDEGPWSIIRSHLPIKRRGLSNMKWSSRVHQTTRNVTLSLGVTHHPCLNILQTSNATAEDGIQISDTE